MLASKKKKKNLKYADYTSSKWLRINESHIFVCYSYKKGENYARLFKLCQALCLHNLYGSRFEAGALNP